MEYRTPNALCGVYKITNNVNGKVYIGQSINIKNRWKDHINALNRKDSSCTLLQRAWNKYKQENFSFEILELCPEDMLDEVETKYIDIYDAHKNGYNIEPGGNSNKCLSDETKQKIREAHLGMKASDETRKKMSESRLGDKNPMYRQTHSEETRKKISEANKGNIPYNKNLRPVYCIELNKVFENVSSAGKELSIRSGNIINCCEHTRKTCGGYHWIYVDTDEYTEFIKSLTIQS